MNKKKVMAAVLSITMVFGAAGTLAHTAAHMFDSAIPASADFASTIPYVEGNVSLNEETGVLTISGQFDREQVEEYWGNKNVKSIVATEDCVLPNDCSYLFATTYDPSKLKFENDSSSMETTASVIDYGNKAFVNVESIDLSKAKTYRVNNMHGMFIHYGYCTVDMDINVSNFDTSGVTDMGEMFSGCSTVKKLNVLDFDTSRVKDMSDMFKNCSELAGLDVSGFDTSRVENMSGMFYGCKALKAIDVSRFSTRNTTCMKEMFGYCSELKSLYLNGFDTSKVTDMSSMFTNCHELTELDLSRFDISSLKKADYMFFGSENLKTIITTKDWNTNEDISLEGMFRYCESLVGGNGTKFDENKTDGEYARADKDGQPGYFTHSDYVKGYTEYDENTRTLTLHGNITKDIYAPSGAKTIIAAEDCVFPEDCSDMFRKVTYGTWEDGTSWDSLAFAYVENIDISKADTSHVKNMSGMFQFGGLPVGGYEYYKNINVSGIDTSNVTNMSSMFSGCHTTVLDVSSFDTSNVTDMSNMFNCSNLKTIYASDKFDMSRVKKSDYMFNCDTIVGGNGTKFDESKNNGEYARIDKDGQPGYFTDIAAKPAQTIGDVNYDGAVDIEDAVKIINHINGVSALNDIEIKFADIDHSGDIDIEDAVALISYINGNYILQ